MRTPFDAGTTPDTPLLGQGCSVGSDDADGTCSSTCPTVHTPFRIHFRTPLHRVLSSLPLQHGHDKTDQREQRLFRSRDMFYVDCSQCFCGFYSLPDSLPKGTGIGQILLIRTALCDRKLNGAVRMLPDKCSCSDRHEAMSHGTSIQLIQRLDSRKRRSGRPAYRFHEFAPSVSVRAEPLYRHIPALQTQ